MNCLENCPKPTEGHFVGKKSEDGLDNDCSLQAKPGFIINQPGKGNFSSITCIGKLKTEIS